MNIASLIDYLISDLFYKRALLVDFSPLVSQMWTQVCRNLHSQFCSREKQKGFTSNAINDTQMMSYEGSKCGQETTRDTHTGSQDHRHRQQPLIGHRYLCSLQDCEERKKDRKQRIPIVFSSVPISRYTRDQIPSSHPQSRSTLK